jgi:glycosyltransferase involved in cell wall biosynthesis
MVKELVSFPGGFCVLMVVYIKDDPGLFSKALHSIFSNTLQPNEVLLVVNGELLLSHENILLRLHKSINNHKLHVIRLQKNIGLAGALNIGLSEAKHPWIVRADPDDYNLVDRFSELANMLSQNPSLDLIGSYVSEMHEEGDQLTVRAVPLTLDAIKDFCRIRNPFNHMTVAYRRSAVLDCGGYPEIYLKEDYGLWAKLMAGGIKAANLNRALVIAMRGSEVVIRRGGIKYALSEFMLQRLLYQLGYKGGFTAIRDGFLRGAIFLAPLRIRSYFYRRHLRKEQDLPRIA